MGHVDRAEYVLVCSLLILTGIDLILLGLWSLSRLCS